MSRLHNRGAAIWANLFEEGPDPSISRRLCFLSCPTQLIASSFELELGLGSIESGPRFASFGHKIHVSAHLDLVQIPDLVQIDSLTLIVFGLFEDGFGILVYEGQACRKQFFSWSGRIEQVLRWSGFIEQVPIGRVSLTSFRLVGSH